jgi:hypothetical protein
VTHQIVRAEELRKGDIVAHRHGGRVLEVKRIERDNELDLIEVRGELGERVYEAPDPVDVYREVVP